MDLRGRISKCRFCAIWFKMTMNFLTRLNIPTSFSNSHIFWGENHRMSLMRDKLAQRWAFLLYFYAKLKSFRLRACSRLRMVGPMLTIIQHKNLNIERELECHFQLYTGDTFFSFRRNTKNYSKHTSCPPSLCFCG